MAVGAYAQGAAAAPNSKPEMSAPASLPDAAPVASAPQAPSQPAPATTFFHVLNDLPVMPGLRELPDEAINFDKPEGRIVTATAVSDHVSPEKIAVFMIKRCRN